MTADDVKYSIERVLDPKTASPWISWLKPIKEIKVVDPLTVQMNLDAPYPLLGSFAGIRASGIIPKGYAEQENLKLKGIGTGPFKLVEYVPAGPDRLRASHRLLGQVAPVPRRDGLQGPDRGERPDRRPQGRPDPVRVPLRPGCGAARGRARDHRQQEPHRLGRRPLHQPAEQAAQRRARPACPADGRRHQRGDPEGRVRRRACPRAPCPRATATGTSTRRPCRT